MAIDALWMTPLKLGRKKEMLTSGDMFLRVIPGPQSAACHLGVPLCGEGLKRAHVPAGGPVLPLLAAPQPAGTAPLQGVLCVCCWRGDKAGAEDAEQTRRPPRPPPAPVLPACLLPSPLRLPPKQISHRFRQKSGQKLMLLRAAWTRQRRLPRASERWRPGQGERCAHRAAVQIQACTGRHGRAKTDPNSPPRHRFITLDFVNVLIYVCTSRICHSMTWSCNRLCFPRRWLLSDKSKRKQKHSSYTEGDGGCTSTENE